METKKKELDLVKMSSSYKIIIPSNVERLIRFLCERVWETEWSGVLFYTPSGNFEDGSLEIRCVDILPMDIGTTTYTEFDMSPDVISYMAQNPELLDCKMGLIHSHNNMSTFLSGTDLSTLQEEGTDRNHFVSLIVNNAGKYTAAITRKVKYKAERELSYDSFGGPVNLQDKEVIEGEEIEYFYLDIVFEEDSDNKFSEVASRLKEIKDNKSKTKAVSSYSPYNYNYGYSYPTNINSTYDKKESEFEKSSYKEPTLFDDFEEVSKVKESAVKDGYVSDSDLITDDVIKQIVTQLVTGSILLTSINKDMFDKAVENMKSRFDKRFNGNTKIFEFWAEELIEFLVWFSVDDPVKDENEIAMELSVAIVKELKKLPSNDYIESYIKILESYVDRV